MAKVWYRITAALEDGSELERELEVTGVAYNASIVDLPVRPVLKEIAQAGPVQSYRVEVLARTALED